MYPHFIEVHDIDGNAGMINIDHIVSVCENQITLSNMKNDKALAVRESYAELKQLVESSGALINMGDPRLDTKNRLTLEDLQKMVGEPIWSSNDSKWYIVRKIDDEKDVYLYSDEKSWFFTAENLIKYPMYRMRRD